MSRKVRKPGKAKVRFVQIAAAAWGSEDTRLWALDADGKVWEYGEWRDWSGWQLLAMNRQVIVGPAAPAPQGEKP